MRPSKTLLVAAALVLLAGCAKENRGSPAEVPPGPAACERGCTDPNSPMPPQGTGSNPAETGYDSGSTAEITFSKSALAKMFYNSNPNNPTNVRINIDMSRESESVIVSYVDNGKVVEAAFGTKHPWADRSNAQYNKWYNQEGKSIYKGIFQDAYGAVILVIDEAFSQGDGQPAQFVGGSLWFQNFNTYYPNYQYQGPLKMCWEITMGPYDCRTWIISGRMNPQASVFPTNHGPDRKEGYTKLGTFTGIKAQDAKLP